MSENLLSHVRDQSPAMVDVGPKAVTERSAKAESVILIPESVGLALKEAFFVSPKGPVFHTAIIAGTMAAKNTAQLIPLCHPLLLSHVAVDISLKNSGRIVIYCEVKAKGPTGVEMEALTGASIAALTIYDMLKALSTEIEISRTRLIEKRGGKRDISRTSSEA